MKYRTIAWSGLLGAGVFLAAAALAQTSMLPPLCATLSGDALDRCVRDLAVPQIEPRIEATELPPPDPAAPANCTRVTAADVNYCIGRNEILIACRNRAKYPDFAACYANFVPNLAKPGVANCAREKPEMRALCAERNAVYAKCLEEPLGYFLCLAHKGKLPERLLKP